MKRFCLLAVALVVAGYSASTVLAKGGGGHGGGHGGHGGHHSSHHSHHHSHHGHHAHHHVAHHDHHHHAFSHDWHHHHGGAWGWGNGGYAWGNPWAATTFGAATAWLGIDALEGAGGGNVTVNTTNNEAANEPAADNVADADQEEAQPENAAALAARGTAMSETDSKFLPLGVFSIAPKGQKEAVALVHLAISKDGLVRGTYYDLKTDKDENIHGSVDKAERTMAWTVGAKGQEVFHAWLEDVTDPPGPVTVRTPEGKTQTWTIARYTEKDEKRAEEAAK